MDYINELWEAHADTVIGTGLQVLYALVILIIGLAVIKRLVKLMGNVLRKRGVDETLIPTLTGIVRIMLLVVLLIAVIEKFGADTTGLVAVLGSLGLAIGLALQGSLANFAGGILILVLKPFKNGDFIQVNGEMGVVDSISIVTTTLKTVDNRTIYMSNGSVAGATITNFSQEENRRLDMVFGIGYGDDFDKAKATLLRLINEDERIHKDPEPFIRVTELGASSVDITVRVWLNAGDLWDVKFDYIEKVKQTFDAEGISFPYPQRDIHVYNEK